MNLLKFKSLSKMIEMSHRVHGEHREDNSFLVFPVCRILFLIKVNLFFLRG